MQLMPGEHDWMNRDPFMRGPGGFGGPAGGGIFQTPQITGGLFGEDPTGKRDAMMAAAAQLLAGSGASPVRRSFGELVGQAMLAGQQARAVSQDRQEDRRYRDAQIKALEAREKEQQSPFGTIDPDQFTPESLKKFQETQDYGVLVPRQLTGQNTADIQNWEFYQKLPPELKKEWMALQRQPTAPQLATINGAQYLVDRINGTVVPLSSTGSEAAAASQIASAKKTGEVTGEAQGAIEKKGINAKGVMDTLDMAEPLIDIATGSATGAALDKTAAFFGKATDGAQATAQLKILQAGLMLNMPRMEGPQSDKDTQLYREAAGQLGDPTVPRDTKKAAVKTIRSIQSKYQENAGIAPAQVRKKYNPKTGKIE